MGWGEVGMRDVVVGLGGAGGRELNVVICRYCNF